MDYITLGIGAPGGISAYVLVGLGGVSVSTSVEPRPTVVPTLELFDGSTWLDLTGDLIVEPLRWSRGIFGAGPLDLLGRPGTMTWGLDNTGTNASETPYLYSPGHTNCLTGFRHGAIVRLKLSDGTNTRYVFRGRIRVIDPDPDLYGLQLTRCMASDWLADLAGFDAGQLDLREEVRSDELLQDLIDSLPTQPVNLDIDAGLDEYRYAFDDLGGDVPKATSVAQDILQSERGFLYLRGDETDGETLRFENRQARAGAEAVATFAAAQLPHASDAVSVPSDLEHIFNDIEVLTVPRRVDETPVVLVRLDTPVEVTPGTTENIFVDYQDPNNEAERVGGKDMIQPALTTDWTANESTDGSGADLSAYVTMSAVFWGSRCMIEISNTHPTRPVFVRGPGSADGLQVRGYGLYRYRPMSSRSTNTDSIDQYGVRQLPSPMLMPYQEDRNIGQGVADLIANIYGGLVRVPLQVRPDTFSSAAAIEQGIRRDIGDPITLIEVATGIEGLCFIHGLEQELGVDNLLKTIYHVAPGDTSDVFILDDPDHGVLDQNVLAYA